jgi:hypothetical protein
MIHKHRPYDKSHGFHSNQEGLHDIQHDDVFSPPVTKEGHNPQHGNDGTGSSKGYTQSDSRRDKGLPPDAEEDRGRARDTSRH